MQERAGYNWRGYAFIGPAAVYLAVFSLLPIILAVYMSLFRWSLLDPQHDFVALGNYGRLIRDPFFVGAVKNTLLYVLTSVPLGVITALLVALMVARPLRGMGLFRTLFYVPGVCSQVALSMVVMWILMPEVGLLNYGMGLINKAAGTGIPTDTAFLREPGWAMAALVAMSLWIGLGPRMIIFVAGIQNISEELYEAASLDGCVGWRRFTNITLPMLAPTLLFVSVTTTIAAFQLFTPVYVMTKGGPDRSTDVVLFHIFKELWWRREIGMASAMSCVLLVMILLIAAFQLYVMRRGLHTEESR